MTGGAMSIQGSLLTDSRAKFGGALSVGGGRLSIRQSSIVNNSALGGYGGAIFVDYGGHVEIQTSSLAGNTAHDGSAIHVNLGTLDVLGSSIAQNTAYFPSGCAIHVVGAQLHRLPVASVDIRDSGFADNKVEDGSTSIAVVAESPKRFKLYNTSFQPFEVGSVSLNVIAGCGLYPCDPGQSCHYEKFSILCTDCPPGTISPDGSSCTWCKAGTGPNANRTVCDRCTGNDYSSTGICAPCPPNQIVSANGAACIDCPGDYHIGREGRCVCDTGSYDASTRRIDCHEQTRFSEVADTAAAVSSTECLPCGPCIDCAQAGQPPTVQLAGDAWGPGCKYTSNHSSVIKRRNSYWTNQAPECISKDCL